ncbi:MAG TPA: hypothetical protein VF556_10485 [Pyrinomonadaceae bacterium]|jgi:hypothetical protein
MINTSLNVQQKVFVIFELNADGTVLYFRDAGNGFASDLQPNPIGHNFFEITLFENAEELRHRFNNFIKGHDTVENFKTTLSVANDLLPARVMLMRVFERSNNERAQSVIVDIRSV